MTDEKTPEKIVLPRSGLVLHRVQNTDNAYRAPMVGLNRYLAGGVEVIYHDDATEEFPNEADGIAALDEDVLWLRSALLAGAEETVARACFEWDRGATWEERTNSDVENYMDQARAVIAALCGEEEARG